MARPIWKGQVSFGLVNVPITIYSAERRTDLSFHLVDSRNSARVRYERVNEETGKEVPWDAIVKGYEYDQGSYVILSDEELQRAAVEMTKTIEIEQFVELSDIDAIYFDRPYYVVPGKGGEKGYVLLREAMKQTGKVGIAKVVIRTRQYLSALKPEGHALLLNLLRFNQEIVPLDEFDIPGKSLKTYHVTQKEVDLAKQLIEGMTETWKPESYQDEYRDALMKLIEKKISTGKTAEILEGDETPEPQATETINFMDVLKKSLGRKPVKKTPARKTRGSTKKKRVG
jgi:DNA end-binding protein Ku